MNRIKLLVSAVAFASLSQSALAAVNISGSLTSDYVFRGVSQTNSAPALQLGVDYADESGLYAGTWASNVDFGDDATAEIDFFAGYGGKINEIISYDVSYVYYTYTGYNSDDNANFGELMLNTYINALTLTVAYAPDLLNTGADAQYLAAAYDIELGNDYVVTLHSGYSFGDAFNGNEYVDYGVTFAKTFSGVDISAAVSNTDIEESDTADLRFLLAAAVSF